MKNDYDSDSEVGSRFVSRLVDDWVYGRYFELVNNVNIKQQKSPQGNK